MEAAPPGVSGEGVGAARKRWKKANLSIALIASSGCAASTVVTLLGTCVNWHDAVSLRSVWNSSLVIPISTLYASPENNSSDLFCAFHPKRAMVPSLPLWFVRPEMPSAPLRIALLAWFARITLSGICSIRPAPNTGVGIRKITLPSASCASKSGCSSAHPGASARPASVNKAWTPPSRVPSGFLTNLASRTGPSARMNGGMRLVAPLAFANATWGLANGLVPPVAGCAWQPAQASRFILGPRPSSMLSTCSNSSLPTWKTASSAALRPATGLPASAVPKRTPGSLATGSSEDAVLTSKRNEPAAAAASKNGSANLVFTGFSLPPEPANTMGANGNPVAQRRRKRVLGYASFSFPTLLRLSAPEKKYDKEEFLRRDHPAVGTARQDQTTRQKQDNARNQTRSVTRRLRPSTPRAPWSHSASRRPCR